MKSNNPLLEGIMNYLVEEASAEEEELLGGHGSPSGSNTEDAKTAFERNEDLMKVSCLIGLLWVGGRDVSFVPVKVSSVLSRLVRGPSSASERSPFGAKASAYSDSLIAMFLSSMPSHL